MTTRNAANITVLVLSFMSAGSLPAAEATHPVVTSLSVQLLPIVRTAYPNSDIAFESDRMTASANTRSFTVHGGSKIGKWSTEPHIEKGPSFEGFILTIAVHDGPYRGAAVIPQTLKRPYWRTFLDAAEILDEDRHITVHFSYGARVTRELLQAATSILRTGVADVTPLGPEGPGINPPAQHPEE
ncbi:MAG: hypothetical protein GY906_21140 [bacterium]|nr:hypothetical protein [bacterium]